MITASEQKNFPTNYKTFSCLRDAAQKDESVDLPVNLIFLWFEFKTPQMMLVSYDYSKHYSKEQVDNPVKIQEVKWSEMYIKQTEQR